MDINLSAQPPATLLVVVTHEPFVDGFTLEYEDQSEDLDHVEALEWFKKRGAADMDKVNDLINHAWNFHRAEITIRNPKTVASTPGTPRV
jgi:hypothetical protein